MANVKIGNLTIKSDRECWTIYETKIMGEKSKNAGQSKEIIIGYYPFLSYALDAITERDLQESDAKDVSDLIAEVRALKAEIKKIK